VEPHSHAESDRQDRQVLLEQQLLAKNDHLAAHNREWLATRQVTVINLMSAPGSGKTTLLERTVGDLGSELTLGVIEGDQETLVDAQRIKATGCPVVQINTGAGCHLDADMTARGLASLDPTPGSLVIIENVGNLVCPALFDLGESARAVIVSTTEGPDKPLKYPQMFIGAQVVVINKVDLLPYLDVTLDQLVASVRAVNPSARLIAISATRGDGLDEWYQWLFELRTHR
jgi:hydrogenase nickel incorporation protein HypB